MISHWIDLGWKLFGQPYPVLGTHSDERPTDRLSGVMHRRRCTVSVDSGVHERLLAALRILLSAVHVHIMDGWRLVLLGALGTWMELATVSPATTAGSSARIDTYPLS